MNVLCTKKCVPCEGGTPPLDETTRDTLLSSLNGWSLNENKDTLQKRFEFKGYGKTMAFANAVAWIAHTEGHHPDLQITYNTCTVLFTTHAISNLTENDFICAAKVDAL